MKILKIKTPKRELGTLGEKMDKRYLRKNGYKIRKMNFVADGHEIDIIAESRDVVAIVEVKTRSKGHIGSYESRPAASVTPEKQRSIISAAKCFLGQKTPGKPIRLDVIEVYLENIKGKDRVAGIKHLEAAFNLDTARTGFRKDRR